MTVASGGESDPVLRGDRQAVGRAARRAAAVRQRAVPDDRSPPGARQDRLARAAPAALRTRSHEDDHRRGSARSRSGDRLADSRLLQPYGVRVLGTYRTRRGVFRSRSSSFPASTMARCARSAAVGRSSDLGQHLPYTRVSFGLDALEVRGAGAAQLRRHARRSRNIPTRDRARA